MAKHSSSKKSASKQPAEDSIDLTAAMAPVAIIGATFVARKAAEVLYKAATGKQPPSASDPDAKAVNVLTWSVAVAGAVALTEIAVSRLLPKKK